MNAETSKAGKTIWAFDLGKGSIGEAVLVLASKLPAEYKTIAEVLGVAVIENVRINDH
jgi:hypothetical protein